MPASRANQLGTVDRHTKTPGRSKHTESWSASCALLQQPGQNPDRRLPPTKKKFAGEKTLLILPGFAPMSPSEVVAALRAPHVNSDQRNKLAFALDRYVRARAGRRVGSFLGHCRDEIVDRVSLTMMEAALEPESTDGRAIEEHFDCVLMGRTLDAVRAEKRHAQRLVPIGDEPDDDTSSGSAVLLSCAGTSIDPDHILALISDPRRRDVLRLAMLGASLSGDRLSISSILKIDPKTAAAWLQEARNEAADILAALQKVPLL